MPQRSHKHQKLEEQEVPRSPQPHCDDLAPLFAERRVFHEYKKEDIGGNEIKYFDGEMPLEMLQEVVRFFENDVFVERECGDVAEDERDDGCADVPHVPVQQQEIRRELHNRSGTSAQDV